MKKSITSIILALVTAGTFGAVKLDPVFSSNMVLQQGKPISFFGTADPNSEIKVVPAQLVIQKVILSQYLSL